MYLAWKFAGSEEVGSAKDILCNVSIIFWTFQTKEWRILVLFEWPLIPMFGLLLMPALGFKAKMDPSLACFITCVQWISQIDPWCDTC